MDSRNILRGDLEQNMFLQFDFIQTFKILSLDKSFKEKTYNETLANNYFFIYLYLNRLQRNEITFKEGMTLWRRFLIKNWTFYSKY